MTLQLNTLACLNTIARIAVTQRPVVLKDISVTASGQLLKNSKSQGSV